MAPPWNVSGVAYEGNLRSLGLELCDFEQYVSINDDEIAARHTVVEAVRSIVRTIDDFATVSCFGSFKSGVALYNSDIDIGIEGITGNHVSFLQRVSKELGRERWVGHIEFRARAAVPIVVFTDKQLGVSVDISVQGRGGVDGEATTRAVAGMIHEWPGLFRPLACLMKVILDQNDLNKPFTGGLGSFKACALVSVFLERRHRARDSMDLGACLHGLLKFVRGFDFPRTTLRYPKYETDFSKVFRWFDITRLAGELLRDLESSGYSLARLLDVRSLAGERSLALAKCRQAVAPGGGRGGAQAPAPPPPLSLFAPVRVTRLAIFDFDGTLVNTPEPEEGKRAYLQITGREWPRRGWWGHPESLDPPMPVSAGPALADYQRLHDAGAASCRVVMMTGRRAALADSVRALLHRFRIFPDSEFYNSSGVDTAVYKASAIRGLLRQHPHLTRVDIWEDRPEHVRALRELGEQLRPRLEAEWAVHAVGPAAGAAAGAAAGPGRAPALGDGAEGALPRFGFDGEYVRLIVPVPAAAAALPRAWVRAKEHRDGREEAHVTLLNRRETDRVLSSLEKLHGYAGAPATFRRLRERVLSTPTAVEEVGVGVVVEGQRAAAFVVCRWRGGEEFRREARLPLADFHITLGFTGGADVHTRTKGEASVIRPEDYPFPPPASGAGAPAAAAGRGDGRGDGGGDGGGGGGGSGAAAAASEQAGPSRRGGGGGFYLGWESPEHLWSAVERRIEELRAREEQWPWQDRRPPDGDSEGGGGGAGGRRRKHDGDGGGGGEEEEDDSRSGKRRRGSGGGDGEPRYFRGGGGGSGSDSSEAAADSLEGDSDGSSGDSDGGGIQLHIADDVAQPEGEVHGRARPPPPQKARRRSSSHGQGGPRRGRSEGSPPPEAKRPKGAGAGGRTPSPDTSGDSWRRSESDDDSEGDEGLRSQYWSDGGGRTMPRSGKKRRALRRRQSWHAGQQPGGPASGGGRSDSGPPMKVDVSKLKPRNRRKKDRDKRQSEQQQQPPPGRGKKAKKKKGDNRMMGLSLGEYMKVKMLKHRNKERNAQMRQKLGGRKGGGGGGK